MPSEGLTAAVAAFVASTSFADIPADVMHLGKKSILDALGPALVGATTYTSRILQNYVKGCGIAHRGATVIGTDLRFPDRFAALVNGTSTHADDYDDTMQAATGKFQGIHPTAPVLSAILAVAEMDEAVDRSGRNLLAAYHLGVEVACKLFDATHANHILQGFHSTGTCGLLGATAAVAKLRGLSAGMIRSALGIAASQASGLQENFGTMTKPYHAGRSAEGAIIAVDLARAGFTASPIILEAQRGFFQAYGGGWEQRRIEGRLGNPWSFVDRGVWLKPWPTGSLSHPAMTLFLDLVQEHDIDPDAVTRISITTSENIHRTLLHHRPTTELEAKFSLEFCVAALVLDRKLGLRDFTDDYVRSWPIQRLIELTDYSTFSEAKARAVGYTIVTSLGAIDRGEGARVSGRRDYGKGSSSNPMTDAEVEQKFYDCVRFCDWPVAKAAQVVDLVAKLETVPDVRALAETLSRRAP